MYTIFPIASVIPMSDTDDQSHRVFCIISDHRVFGSKSPTVFNRVMTKLGFNATYVPFQVEAKYLGDAVRSLKILNIAGANISVPYKEAVIPYIDELSESANIIGAINTIAINGDQIKGYNTNAIGIMDALEDVAFNPAGKKALILGAGGAARAVAFVLNWLKAEKIYIVGRNGPKARNVASRVRGAPLSFDDLANDPVPAHILINATTVSSAAESHEMAEMAQNLDIPGCELVFDLNYDREPNIWESLAKNDNISFMDGLPTLIHQARNSLALWTGIDVTPEDFKNALTTG